MSFFDKMLDCDYNVKVILIGDDSEGKLNGFKFNKIYN